MACGTTYPTPGSLRISGPSTPSAPGSQEDQTSLYYTHPSQATVSLETGAAVRETRSTRQHPVWGEKTTKLPYMDMWVRGPILAGSAASKRRVFSPVYLLGSSHQQWRGELWPSLFL